MEVLLAQDHDPGILQGADGGRAGHVVEKGQLPEELEGIEHGQGQLLALRSQKLDLDAALQEDDELVSGIALGDQDRPSGVFPGPDDLEEGPQVLGSQAFKERNLPQETDGVFRRLDRPGGPALRS
jgi:hypothetical protein